MTGEVHRVVLEFPSGGFESARIDMASSRILIANDVDTFTLSMKAPMTVSRKFHGKELDPNNSCKSGSVSVLAKFRIDIGLEIIVS